MTDLSPSEINQRLIKSFPQFDAELTEKLASLGHLIEFKAD